MTKIEMHEMVDEFMERYKHEYPEVWKKSLHKSIDNFQLRGWLYNEFIEWLEN